jgi:hypothetical protein
MIVKLLNISLIVVFFQCTTSKFYKVDEATPTTQLTKIIVVDELTIMKINNEDLNSEYKVVSIGHAWRNFYIKPGDYKLDVKFYSSNRYANVRSVAQSSEKMSISTKPNQTIYICAIKDYLSEKEINVKIFHSEYPDYEPNYFYKFPKECGERK